MNEQLTGNDTSELKAHEKLADVMYDKIKADTNETCMAVYGPRNPVKSSFVNILSDKLNATLVRFDISKFTFKAPRRNFLYELVKRQNIKDTKYDPQSLEVDTCNGYPLIDIISGKQRQTDTAIEKPKSTTGQEIKNGILIFICGNIFLFNILAIMGVREYGAFGTILWISSTLWFPSLAVSRATLEGLVLLDLLVAFICLIYILHGKGHLKKMFGGGEESSTSAEESSVSAEESSASAGPQVIREDMTEEQFTKIYGEIFLPYIEKNRIIFLVCLDNIDKITEEQAKDAFDALDIFLEVGGGQKNIYFVASLDKMPSDQDEARTDGVDTRGFINEFFPTTFQFNLFT